MNIKIPAVYDVSHWERIPDFALLNPRPVLVITKATEGTWFVDSTFARYFADMKQDGIRRGGYHFFRKSANGTSQADFFWQTIRPHLTPADVLALDIEEGGESASQLLLFLNYIKDRCDNLILIYSSKSILDAIIMTSSQAEQLRKFPTWIAGYPANPDNYSSIPSSYVPNPAKWGAPWLWQYTDKGLPAGASGDGTDCNWISPLFLAWLGGVPIPPSPPPATAKSWRVKTPLNVRTGPGITFKIIRTLRTNDIIEGVYDELTKWIKIISITSNGIKTIPTSAAYCSGNPLYVTPVIPPDQRTTIKIVINDVTDFEKEVLK
jgi:lysozyme